jgi:hypothetical protein
MLLENSGIYGRVALSHRGNKLIREMIPFIEIDLLLLLIC